MSHKKPSLALPPPAKAGVPAQRRPAGKARPFAGNPRLQADNRWQRTKRYGWNSR